MWATRIIARRSIGFASRPPLFSTASTTTPEFTLTRCTSNPHITHLTMSRPASRNALGNQMMEEFSRHLDSLNSCPSTRCVILSSSVERVFSAGADLKERKVMSPIQAGQFVSHLRSSFTSLANLPMPVIAVVEGAALGGGLEIALCADFIIAGEGSSFGLPETGLGIIPGAGGTQRLPRLIGTAKSKELMFTGRRIKGEEAHTIGIAAYLEVSERSEAKRSEQVANSVCVAGSFLSLAALT